jgi:hypothetical protein
VTFSLAALVLTNLVYVVGAVVVATLISGLYVLRHRKPKSLESGIESFSRELQALAPERRSEDDRATGYEPPGVSGVSGVTGVPGVRVQPVAPTPAAGRRRTRGGVATATRRPPAPARLSAGSEAEPATGAPAPDDGGAETSGGRPG